MRFTPFGLLATAPACRPARLLWLHGTTPKQGCQAWNHAIYVLHKKRGTMLCKMHMEPRRQILYNIIIPSAPKWGDIMALSEKKAITDKRHQDKLDKIKIQPYKNQGAALRAAAAAAGQSVQGYVLQAVQARMKQEGLEWPEPDKSGEEGG